jgi:LPS-assembly protein
MARHDNYAITPFNQSGGQGESEDASRTIGHVGLDTRWTFIRPGERVDLTLEPRIQAVYAGGNDEANTLLSTYREDSLDIDLDKALLWSANKSTGFDLFQKGTRVDAGVSLTGNWGGNRASAFLGQSYASGYDAIFAARSGLSGDSSDYIGEFEIDLSRRFAASTRLRYDDDVGVLRRIDSSVNYTGERLKLGARYYKINDPFDAAAIISTIDAPPEAISGSATYRFSKNWTARYRASRDIDAGLTRREELGFVFNDDCTRLEVFYEKKRNNIGLTGNSSGFGVRISLLTLGDFTDN